MADLSWTKCSTRKQGSVLQEVQAVVDRGKKVEQEARCLENPRIVYHHYMYIHRVTDSIQGTDYIATQDV